QAINARLRSLLYIAQQLRSRGAEAGTAVQGGGLAEVPRIFRRRGERRPRGLLAHGDSLAAFPAVRQAGYLTLASGRLHPPLIYPRERRGRPASTPCPPLP